LQSFDVEETNLINRAYESILCVKNTLNELKTGILNLSVYISASMKEKEILLLFCKTEESA
jgi:hypothetical protein